MRPSAVVTVAATASRAVTATRSAVTSGEDSRRHDSPSVESRTTPVRPTIQQTEGAGEEAARRSTAVPVGCAFQVRPPSVERSTCWRIKRQRLAESGDWTTTPGTRAAARARKSTRSSFAAGCAAAAGGGGAAGAGGCACTCTCSATAPDSTRCFVSADCAGGRD